MVRLAIYDYGVGNIFSLKNSLERTGAQCSVVEDLDSVSEYSGLLLPGVGNFDPAVERMQGQTASSFDIPVLGICLGMELFFDKSQEGTKPGLGLIPGDVISLPDSLKIPHMGWNSLDIQKPGRLLDGVPEGSWVYFVHSYMASPRQPDIITASSDYGVAVPAVIEQKNLFGTQFHPEKSGNVGQTILSNFVGECRR